MRSKLVRALLAAASLLAAVPLMAQTRATTVAAAPTFPYGKYDLQAIDSAHSAPPGIVVEFTPGGINVLNGDQVVETHAMEVTGDQWTTYMLEGPCQDTGTYKWHLEGKVLWMELVSDPCTQRAMNITSVRFVPKG
jgi:hypothetical protein